MLYTAYIRNSSGGYLKLSGNEPDYQIVSINGLNPPQAQINTTPIAGMDGAKFNSSKLNMRNIVIMLKLQGNVEQNRLKMYQMFRTKDECTFYYQTESRNVFVRGYVESVEVSPFSQNEIMQISIICPYPYFKSIASVIVDISNRISGFKFPFSINIGDPIPFSLYIEHRIANVVNDSDSETGMRIRVDVLDSINSIKITNTDTAKYIELIYPFIAGDIITINTEKGNKYVYLTRDAVNINIFSSLQQGSDFFQLEPGNNPFTYLVDNGANDENVFITFTYSNCYRGV